MSTERTDSKYIVEMQVARGLGILLVTFGHSEPVRLTFPGIWHLVYSFHMPLFFFMSGFFSRALLERNWRREILPSTLRLYLPYLVISLSYGLIKLVLPELANRPVILAELPLRIFLYPFQNPALFLWFIYVLLLMKLLSPLFRQQRFRWLLPVFFLTACFPGDFEALGFYALLRYLVYYTAGLFLAEYRAVFFALLRRPFYRILATVLFLLLYHARGAEQESGFLAVLTAFAGIWMTLSWAFLTLPGGVRRPLEYCGRLSLEIYLLQYFFIFPTQFLLQRVGLPPEGIVPCTFAVGLAGPLLSCRFFLDRHRLLSLAFTGRVRKAG